MLLPCTMDFTISATSLGFRSVAAARTLFLRQLPQMSQMAKSTPTVSLSRFWTACHHIEGKKSTSPGSRITSCPRALAKSGALSKSGCQTSTPTLKATLWGCGMGYRYGVSSGGKKTQRLRPWTIMNTLDPTSQWPLVNVWFEPTKRTQQPSLDLIASLILFAAPRLAMAASQCWGTALVITWKSSAMARAYRALDESCIASVYSPNSILTTDLSVIMSVKTPTSEPL
mmetsp:Transcript_16068/g.48277  ORF Transcript_16068/g.48277 Transcript_16068/m.48277 type:complete len:228 (+) Transcript_16068:296-979(+)